MSETFPSPIPEQNYGVEHDAAVENFRHNLYDNGAQALISRVPELAAATEPVTPEDYVNTGSLMPPEQVLREHVHDAAMMQMEGAPAGSVELMMKGSLDGHELVDMYDFIRNGNEMLRIRKTLAEMYAKHPETAEKVVGMDIVGLHGTRSPALASILEHGALLSAAEAKRRGIKHMTGEHAFQPSGGQSSISFTTLAYTENALQFSGAWSYEYSAEQVIEKLHSDIAQARELLNSNSKLSKNTQDILLNVIDADEHIEQELLANPNSLKSELMKDDFPILIGVSDEAAISGFDDKPDSWRPKTGTQSAQNEFRAASEVIDLNGLLMAVPADRVEKVRGLLAQYGKEQTVVVPIEDFMSERYKEKIGFPK